jgi:putative aldouronate transport system substrate-binding protein
MKRWGKTVLSLALLMSAIVAGCSKGGNQPQASGSEQKAKASTNTTVTTLPEKYSPEIDMTMVNFTYNSPKYSDGDDMNNNPWTRLMKDQYGIKVKTLWEVPNNQLEQKTNLMISSGELPDVFLVTPTQFVQLNKAGLIQDLTEVYKLVPPNVKKVLDEAGPEPLQAATINGKLMGIPFTGLIKENVPVLWVREDWKKKLNLPDPKTMQDVLAISKAFTDQDPDGNGKNDTFGLALSKELSFLQGFLNGYHAYKGIWIKDKDGKLVYSSIQPEMRTALNKLQEMYKAGQIDKEYGVKDVAKVNESMGSEKLGMFYDTMFSGSTLQKLTPKNRWIPYPAPSVDDKPTLLQHKLNLNHGFWVVKKGYKNPEAILKMIDAWIQLFYLNTDDELYKKYNADLDISHWMNAPVKIYKSFKNAEASAHLEPILKSGKEPDAQQKAKLTPEERDFYSRIIKYLKEGNMDFWYINAKNGLDGSGTVINNYVKNNQFQPDLFITVPTPAMVQKGANLEKMETEMITKVISGAPIEQFDQFVKEWMRLGGTEITKEVNEWYTSTKG